MSCSTPCFRDFASVNRRSSMTVKKTKPKAAKKSSFRRTPITEISPDEQIVGATFLGKVRAYDAQSGWASLLIEADLSTGDPIRVKSAETDLTQRIERISIGRQNVQSASAGESVKIS